MTDSVKFSAIILAAGNGTRMKSDIPKVLHKVAGLEMIFHVINAAQSAGVAHTTIVTSPVQEDLRKNILANAQTEKLTMAVQEHQLGTGDAVKAAIPLSGDPDKALVLFGDTPLMRPEVLKQMINDSADLTLLGFFTDTPDGYGRIICEDGKPVNIIEHKDADEVTRQIKLCNGGALAVNAELLPNLLNGLENNNAQSEYYLPDIVGLAKKQNINIGLVMCQQEDTMGVDTKGGLAKAEALMQNRLRQKHLDNGVSMIAPETVYFSYDTEIGPDSSIEPHCIFGIDVKIGDAVTIKGFSHLEGVFAESGVQIGPYARLRPGTHLGTGAKIGNFVETKKAQIMNYAKVNHLSYVGDAHIGEGANIGAGTITCNYDGYDKHLTEIGAGAFIGSNSSLIAPVKIGEGAYIGSSSSISGEIEADSLALTRAPLREIEGWSVKFRMKKSKASEAKGD
jgi:bifunctional UDP-N-acetylglucosamine pyrophosphorylase/glucosamine-1-phosphate N-acetyltransferase